MGLKQLVTGCVLIASLPAQAFQPIELSDAELAQLRGRYVLPDSIVSFGVTMTSVWQQSNGQVIGASATLMVSQHSQPALYVQSILQPGTGDAAPGTGQVLGGAGLNSVSGITQSVRTAGDLNEGRNNLNITISRGNQPMPKPQGIAWSGSYRENHGGSRVSLGSVNGGLRLIVDAGSQGIAKQQIASGGVAQQVNIGGSMNRVENLAGLHVALRNDPGVGMSTYCAWQQLRGLQRAGL
jgi:hypothetical protein